MDRGADSGTSSAWRARVEVAYRLHAAKLFDLLRHRHDPTRVEDATQEVFSRLLGGVEPHHRDAAVVLSLPYLVVCVRHALQRHAHRAQLASDRLRRATSRGQLHACEVQSLDSTAQPSVEPNERVDQLAHAMARLSDAEREAIYASTDTGVGDDASAHRLGCTANCAAVRRHRAISHLRQLMGVSR